MRLRSLVTLIAVAIVCCLGVLDSLPSLPHSTGTRLPREFNPDVHVWVAPTWNSPIDTKSLEKRIRNVDDVQLLSTFVVFTYRGNEADASAVFGNARVDDLYRNWSWQNTFPQHSHVLLVIVRNNTNPKQYAIGIKVAHDLLQYVSIEDLKKAVNSNKPKLIQGHAEAYVVSLIEAINNVIGEKLKQQEQAAAEQRAQPHVAAPVAEEIPIETRSQVEVSPANNGMSHGHGWLFYLLWSIVIVVSAFRICEYIYLSMGVTNWKKKIGDPLGNAQELKLKLDSKYLGLLTRTDSNLSVDGESWRDVKAAGFPLDTQIGWRFDVSTMLRFQAGEIYYPYGDGRLSLVPTPGVHPVKLMTLQIANIVPSESPVRNR